MDPYGKDQENVPPPPNWNSYYPQPKYVPDRQELLNMRYRKLFRIPFIFILIAIILMSISYYPNEPEDGDEGFDVFVNGVRTTANMVFTVGILILAFIFFKGAFTDPEMHIAMKLTLIGVGGFILITFLSDGFIFRSFIG